MACNGSYVPRRLWRDRTSFPIFMRPIVIFRIPRLAKIWCCSIRGPSKDPETGQEVLSAHRLFFLTMPTCEHSKVTRDSFSTIVSHHRPRGPAQKSGVAAETIGAAA